PHESPPVMLVPLVVLAVGSVVAGFAFASYFIGDGYAEFWGRSLTTAPGNDILEKMHHVPLWVVWSATIAMLSGFGIAWLYYMSATWRRAATAHRFRPLYNFLLNAWYFDALYDRLFVRPAFWIGRLLWKTGDGQIIDGLGPNGVAARVLDTTGRVVRLQTGYLYDYACAMLFGVAIILTVFMFTRGQQL